MSIYFSCLGFSTASVFANGYHIGYIEARGESNVKFHISENGIWVDHLNPEEIPLAKDIEAQYLAELKEKGVWINDNIAYAG